MKLRRPGHLTQTDRAAFQVLGLVEDPDSYDVLAVDSRWRVLRAELHPDKPGGDAAKFDQARKAYDAARFYALQTKPCPACEGKGKVAPAKLRGGFNAPLELNCGTCKGSGVR